MKCLVVAGIGLIVTTVFSRAQDLPSEWEVRNPFPIGDKLSSIAFANGVFVVVDTSGAILTSSDAISWTNRPIAAGLRAVTFGEGMFVAVGQGTSGRGRVLTSRNAVNWIPRTFAGGGMKSIAYGNGIFAGMGSRALYLSPNGVRWHQVRSSINATLQEIAFGNGQFVAVGSSLANPPRAVVFRSRTGTDWVRQTLADREPWTRVSFAGGQFFATDKYGQAFSSTNGVSWANAELAGARYFDMVVSGGGMVEGIGTHMEFFDSPPAVVTAAAYGNGRFVAVGPGGTIAMSLAGPRSDYENRWQNITSVCSDDLTEVEFGNGIYLASSDGGMMTTSVDGAHWTRQWIGPGGNLFSFGITGLAFGNGLFVAVGPYMQYVASSADGKNWARRGHVTVGSDGFMDVTFGNGMFMAVGYTSTREYGLVLVSNDGMTWTAASRDIYAYGPFTRVDFDGTYFVVTRKDGTLLHTADAETWWQGGPDAWEWPVRGFGTRYGHVNDWTRGAGGVVAVGNDCLILQEKTNQP